MALRDLIIRRPPRKMVDQEALLGWLDKLIADAPKASRKDYSWEAGHDHGYLIALKQVKRKVKARASGGEVDHGH